MDINDLAEKAYEIAVKRAQKGQIEDPCDTEAMLKHCAGEVVEATIAYKDWDEVGRLSDYDCAVKKINRIDEIAHRFTDFAREIADVIMCCLIVAKNENIDIEVALEKCLEKNRKRAEAENE